MPHHLAGQRCLPCFGNDRDQGLRVVDAGGRPPGYPRALARALVGLLGVAVVGAGVVPMAFDPAGRGLHDRLFRTRVVRR